MLGRKNSVQPHDIVLAGVAALAANDMETINKLDPQIKRLTAEQIFSALTIFGKTIKPALNPEKEKKMREAILQEVKTLSLTLDQKKAAAAFSIVLMIDADDQMSAKEINTLTKVIQSDIISIAMACIAAAANVVKVLGIKLNFS
jgi:hypothetical protein